MTTAPSLSHTYSARINSAPHWWRVHLSVLFENNSKNNRQLRCACSPRRTNTFYHLYLYTYVDLHCAWWTKTWGRGRKTKCVTVWLCVFQCVGSQSSWSWVSSVFSPAQRARVGKGSIITRGIPPQNGNWKWIQHTLLTSDLQLKQRQDRERERWREEGEGEGKR